MSENSDTYFKSDSYRSEIRTLRPAASFSIVSIRGLVRSDTISDMVDFGNPVMMDTWRIVRFFSKMISPNRIFIIIFYTIFYYAISGKLW